MSTKKVFRLSHTEARLRAVDAVMKSPDDMVVTISELNRSLDQNAMLWRLLTMFSNQIQWPVNGRSQNLSPEEWKDLLTAGFKAEREGLEIRVAQGLDGGFVMLGTRTSTMGKREFSDFIEYIHAEAASRGLKF